MKESPGHDLAISLVLHENQDINDHLTTRGWGTAGAFVPIPSEALHQCLELVLTAILTMIHGLEKGQLFLKLVLNGT